MARDNIKVIKKQERERRQIRPHVREKLLLDEKSRLMRRVHEINKQLREA